MLSSRGTVFFSLCLLASCQFGEAKCRYFGCSEEDQRQSIAEGGRGRLWEEGIVPFVFDSNLRDELRGSFSRAMAIWERETCIQFVNRTTEEDYITLGERYPCASEAVGRRGGSQFVALHLKSKCGSTGNALHELGHALGFWHEHTRPDRNRFVRIRWQTILCSFCKNFAIVEDNSTLDLPYDLGSIMHYGLRQHSAFRQTTIEVLPSTIHPPSCTKIGQRNALSSLDVLKMNVLYNCTRELERSPKDDCQRQREANPPTFILTGDVVTFSGGADHQRNTCLCCSDNNCSLRPCTSSSCPTTFSIRTVFMTYRSRVYSGNLVVVAGSNGSHQLDCSCSEPPCGLNICPEGEKKVKGEFCVRHLFTIRFKDPGVREGEHEGLQTGTEVSLTPACRGRTPQSCTSCPAKRSKISLSSLIINKLD